jgi:hypothetical protein
MIERGQARNMPRLFDAIQPLHTGPRDMESLDVTSSLAPIRENALKKNAEHRKRNAEKPRVSMLWSDSSQGMQQQSSAASQAAVGGNESAMRGGNSLDGMGGSMDTNQRSKEGNRNSASLGGPTRATRVHHVMSDPSLRASGPQAVVEPAREPKFFGTMPRSLSETGVRCGGFQRLDWPSHNARPGGPAPPAEKGGTKRGGDSRRNESRDHTRSKDTMHSSSTGTAQPL